MKKTFEIAYAGLAYILATANILYIMGFLIDFGVPISINSGIPGDNPWSAAVINSLLVLGFGLHHSITARPWFKKWWTRYIPQHLERSTYLYMTAMVTAVLVVFWQPIPISLWIIKESWAELAAIIAYIMVWSIMFAATFHFGNFSFFGIGEVLARYRNQKPSDINFSARYLYALVRHPISLGWMLTPWLVPHFTLGQLVFAITVGIYVLVATLFEERDLIKEFGQTYREYRKKVPAFIPFTLSGQRFGNRN